MNAAWSYILLFVLLLGLSAFFSGSEAAFFSLSPLDIKKIREKQLKSGRIRRVVRLLEKPKRLLSSILMGNTVVNVAASTVAVLFVNRFITGGKNTVTGSILLVLAIAVCIILLGEILPKIVAIRLKHQVVEWVSLPVLGLMLALFPFSYVFEKIMKGFTVLFRLKGESAFVNQEELKTLFEIGEEQGTLDATEREMIHSIFEFRETMAKEIMVPRMDMVCIDQDASFRDALALLDEKKHSRIPVFRETVDNIVGILYVKDLLSMLHDKQFDLKGVMRKAYFVPGSKYIDELLREFQTERTHMAIVVDEYGGTAGLITLEDVIEEIVGDIRDEHDRETPLIRRISGQSWMAEGKIAIDELNERMGLNLPSGEDYESLGGFILNRVGSIPEEKDVIEYEGYRFVIEKIHRQRIRKIRIIRGEPVQPASRDQKQGMKE
ncbi:HlyC/CorC family transporter [bacterium]|nr:HlyC/CorC family transporter [bacterium]